MPVVFNGGQGKNNSEQPKNDIIKKIVTVIQKLEEEIISNKRTVNSKINGNTFSLTEQLRDLSKKMEEIDTRVSTIGERSPEEIMIDPVKEMVSEGYNSIQIKGSSDLLAKTTELNFADQSLSVRIDDEVKARESVSLSLATDIVAVEERSRVSVENIKSRFDEINQSPVSVHTIQEMKNTVDLLKSEIERLKRSNEELSAKLDKETFSEMNQRVQQIKSIEHRLNYGF